jgi:hypothetical protein
MSDIRGGWTRNKCDLSPIIYIIIIIIGLTPLELQTSYMYTYTHSVLGPKQAFSQEEGSNFLLYENPRFGLTMQYPADWDKKEYSTNPSANDTIAEFVGPSASLVHTPLLSIFVYPSNGTTLENTIDETIKDIENTHVNSSRLDTLDNNTKAYLINYTIDTTHAVFQKMQIWTEKSGYIYVITYTEMPNRFKTYLPLVHQMLDSVNIRPISGSTN